MTEPDLVPWPNKTPSEEFPVAVDWSPLARGSDLVAATVGVLSGTVTVDQPAETTIAGTIQTVWLKGGKAGEYASFVCHAVFADQAEFDQRFYLFVK